MAAPALAESRTACPACGQLIHPIAGRCKHCKVDLTRHRGGGGAGTPRPRLVALGGDHHAPPSVVVDQLGLAGSGPAPAPSASPPVYLEASTTLDAREPVASGWSRRWPVIVAVIAVLAIVVSLAFLVFDLGRGKKKHGPLKALGPSIELTPNDRSAPPSGTAPTPTPSVPTPGAPDPHPDPDLADPFGAPPPAPVPTPMPPPTTGSARDLEQFIEAAVDTGCRRLTQCSGGSASIATQCAMARGMISQMKDIAQSMCPAFDPAAAQQCLGHIAQLPCTDDPDPQALAQTLLGLQGCVTICGAGAFGNLDLDDPLTP